MEMTDLRKAVSLLGSSGGLANAVLALLDAAAADPTDPLHADLTAGEIHLIDKNQATIERYADRFPHLSSRIRLHQFDLRDIEAFKRHLDDTGTKLVIDVSWADTLSMLECCNELGVSYLNTALENAEVDADPTLYGFPLTERYERFEKRRTEFGNLQAVVCSGMNPGVVQWMAWELTRGDPGRDPLACYIVERDTSFFADPALFRPKTVYASWSIECFLDEAILSYPMFVRDRLPHYFREEVYDAEYKITLGDVQFYGCLMPHEEVLTLGTLKDWETGFVYRVSERMTRVIRDHLDNVDELWEWEQTLLDPSVGEIDGEDLVGVLLVYENEEKYMYNVLSSREIYPVYRTNATYFQVACGVYAAAACLLSGDVPRGVHYVDELLHSGHAVRYGEYLQRYMTAFVRGTNPKSDGLLSQRRREA
ncbi:saccharopine dehydrogenase NADP-binding domain-containing protein [Paenibacillaceae bacterium WGS1546]|uniref:saccharopine dehydrogenase NADP-binding domain-containing protein n=1 Tax=Cohnella sp. WGS1546 TaxID=3366810 RepID=UPI00372D0BFC